MVQVFAVSTKLDLEPEVYDYLFSFIDQHSKEKIVRFVKQSDAVKTLISNVLIRSIVIEACGISNKNIIFNRNEYGKPYLDGNVNFHFNLSHSGDWCVCATDDESIGVDVEKILPIDYTIAERFFSTGELTDLQQVHGEEKLKCFYNLWTLKESYVKAWGKGLSIPLNSFDISIFRDCTIKLYTENEFKHCNFKMYDIETNYKMSVCSLKNVFPSQVLYKNINEIICMLEK